MVTFDPTIYAADPSVSWHVPRGTPAAREVESLLRQLEISLGSHVTIADADGNGERQLGDLRVWPVSVLIEPDEGEPREVELYTDGHDAYREGGDGYVTAEWLAETLGLPVRPRWEPTSHHGVDGCEQWSRRDDDEQLLVTRVDGSDYGATVHVVIPAGRAQSPGEAQRLAEALAAKVRAFVRQTAAVAS